MGTTWTLANEYPATTLPAQADAYFALRVGELTGGRITVTPYFDATLGITAGEHLAAVASGRTPIASTFGGVLGATEPIFFLSTLPFLTAVADDAKQLFDLSRLQYESAFERHNQRLLYVSPWLPAGLWAKEAITTLDALKRQRIRTYDETSARLFASLGAQSLTTSFADALPRIASEDITAVLSSGDGGAGPRLWQHLAHFTEINYAIPLSFAALNLGAWKALDDSDQRAVSLAATATTERQWQQMIGRVETNHRTMREHRVAITTTLPDRRAA